MINVVELGGGVWELRVFGKSGARFSSPGPAYKIARTLRQLTADLANYAPTPVVEGRAVVVGDRRKVCRTAADARLVAGLVKRFFCFASEESPKHRVPVGATGRYMTFLTPQRASEFALAVAEIRRRSGFSPIAAEVVSVPDDGSGLRFSVKAAGVLLPIRLDRGRAERLAEWVEEASGFQPTLKALAQHFAAAR